MASALRFMCNNCVVPGSVSVCVLILFVIDSIKFFWKNVKKDKGHDKAMVQPTELNLLMRRTSFFEQTHGVHHKYS